MFMICKYCMRGYQLVLIIWLFCMSSCCLCMIDPFFEYLKLRLHKGINARIREAICDPDENRHRRSETCKEVKKETFDEKADRRRDPDQVSPDFQ